MITSLYQLLLLLNCTCFMKYRGSKGLKFLKDDLQIGKEGLTSIASGEIFAELLPEDIEFHDVIGRGAAGYVQRAIYKPKGISLAIKVHSVLLYLDC